MISVPVPGKRGVLNRAFTLVELLVVIAIIAVLGAVLLASLSGAIKLAQTAKCAGNLKAIGAAFQGYLGDNNNTLPQRYSGSYPNGVGYSNLLLPYLGNNGQIFICPSHPQCSWPLEPSYGMNWYYDNANVLSVQQNSAGQPVGFSTTILATDVNGSTGTGSNRADQNSGDPGELAPTRHGTGANYLFFDGHVEKLPFSATQTPLNLWGTDDGNHNQTTASAN